MDNTPCIAAYFAPAGAAYGLWRAPIAYGARAFSYSSMRKFILFSTFLSFAFACIACAASTPSQKADKTYASFMHACSKSDTDAANQLMLESNQRIDPCPSDTPELPEKTEIIATHPMAQMTKIDGQWKLNPAQSLSPDSPQFALKQLKYAILNQNVQSLMPLLSNTQSEEQLKAWLESAEANEIYSAIAITPNPWFILEGKTAICKVAGIQLQFELIDNAWKWHMN